MMDDSDFIGLSKQDALESCQAHGIICRIAMEDGKHRALTDDIMRERLNFTIADGKVISVVRG